MKEKNEMGCKSFSNTHKIRFVILCSSLLVKEIQIISIAHYSPCIHLGPKFQPKGSLTQICPFACRPGLAHRNSVIVHGN